MNQVERQDRSLRRAEKRVEVLKDRYHYRLISVPCCSFCKFSSQMSIEDPLECKLLEQANWTVNDVQPFGTCDKFVEKTD